MLLFSTRRASEFQVQVGISQLDCILRASLGFLTSVRGQLAEQKAATPITCYRHGIPTAQRRDRDSVMRGEGRYTGSLFGYQY